MPYIEIPRKPRILADTYATEIKAILRNLPALKECEVASTMSLLKNQYVVPLESIEKLISGILNLEDRTRYAVFSKEVIATLLTSHHYFEYQISYDSKGPHISGKPPLGGAPQKDCITLHGEWVKKALYWDTPKARDFYNPNQPARE